MAYATRSTAGLKKQGWKGSANSILFRDGIRAGELSARDLGERFNRDFWMEERGYYALALDGAPRFDYRLPEVFAGYSRRKVGEPVEMPRTAAGLPFAARRYPGFRREPRHKKMVAPKRGRSPGGLQLSCQSIIGAHQRMHLWPSDQRRRSVLIFMIVARG